MRVSFWLGEGERSCWVEQKVKKDRKWKRYKRKTEKNGKGVADEEKRRHFGRAVAGENKKHQRQTRSPDRFSQQEYKKEFAISHTHSEYGTRR